MIPPDRMNSLDSALRYFHATPNAFTTLAPVSAVTRPVIENAGILMLVIHASAMGVSANAATSAASRVVYEAMVSSLPLTSRHTRVIGRTSQQIAASATRHAAANQSTCSFA